MLQFTEEQFSFIKSRAFDHIIEEIKKDNHVVLSSNLLVPPDNRATWNHYYFCPDHGVRLIWDRDNNTQHRCPIDDAIFSGEPFDGAWWRWLNGLNAKACNELGLLWQLTGDVVYLQKVKAILLAYAKYYPDYEVHGGIPYNGPGKANAQTLCEANCHLDLALGYDFVKEDLNNDERSTIENRLLREGADFLMAHRSRQLHNHEMKINATVGVIGLILEDNNYIHFALETEYGFHYQLNHGLVGEGFWFEGSLHYHYYALQALISYEKLARNTPFSIRNHPKYYQMLTFPLHFVLNTGDFPRMNDCVAGQEKITESTVYEFAYSEFDDPIFASALMSVYKNMTRDNMDALLYGVENLPIVAPLQPQNIHAPGCGVTLLTDQASNNQVLFKHAPYGGEHDHYDRLGLTLIKNGLEILPDLGTCGYGAELHYGYYKNSATHNTLVVNQHNQTPANPVLLNVEQQTQYTFVDTLVDWRSPIARVDSHTLEHWNSDSYQDIQFRRSIVWLGSALIEINQITNPYQQQLDLTWHTRGQLQTLLSDKVINSPLVGPLSRLHHCREQHAIAGIATFTYAVNQATHYHQHIAQIGGDCFLTGQAPDNPATSDLSYLLLRSQQKRLKNVVLHDLQGNYQLLAVDWLESDLHILFFDGEKQKKILINFEQGTLNYQ